MERRRAGLALLLATVGAVLLVYGLGFRSIAVTGGTPTPPPTPDTGTITPVSAVTATAVSEPAVTREITRGGVQRDESGALKKTYEEGSQAPQACPT
jgi:hypothetical protein